MSSDYCPRMPEPARGALVGTYLSWYIACFQSGNS
jgi:hypothetical protein